MLQIIKVKRHYTTVGKLILCILSTKLSKMMLT